MDRVAREATYAVIRMAENQRGALSDEQAVALGHRFAAWLEEDRARIDHLIDNPERAINMFMTDAFGELQPDFTV